MPSIEEKITRYLKDLSPSILALEGTGSIDIDCSACTGGPNEPDCGLRIDDDRFDWIFRDPVTILSSLDCAGQRLGSTAFTGSATVVSPEIDKLPITVRSPFILM